MRVGRVAAAGWALATLSACAATPPPVEVAPAPPPAPPPVRIADANQAFSRGEYADAVQAYDAVLAREPDNATAHYNRGLALQRTGDFRAAESAYERALELNPKDVEAALNLGAVKNTLGDRKGAIALYRRFLKTDEFNPRLLNNTAALYRAEGRYRQAIAAVRKLLMRDKDNVDAYKNLALIYFDQKKYTLARTILDNALRLSKAQGRVEPDIYVNVGRILLAEGENGQAMAAFKRAVQLEPGHAVASYNIGALALRHRDYQTAAGAYEVCVKAWPEKYDVWASLGFAYQGLQAFVKAERHLAKGRALLRNQSQASASAALRRRLAKEDEQMLYQLVSTAQGAQQTKKALGYAEEYMRVKGVRCQADDTDGFCGRYNGIKLTLELEAEATPQPAGADGAND